MKMRYSIFLLAIALSFAGIQSCSDEGFSTPNPSTVANFSYVIDNNAFAPATVTFTDLSILPDRAGNATYAWNFGDGTSSTEVSPTHYYEEPGAYTVSLVLVTDKSLEIIQRTQNIVLKDPNASGVPFFFWAGGLRSTIINEQPPIVSTITAPGLTSSYGMVVDTVNNKLYVGDDAAGKIYSVNADGTGFAEFRTGVGSINGLTIDYQKDHLYWGTEEGEIRRATLTVATLSQMETVVVGQDYPLGLAIDPVGRKLYWNNYNGGVWSKGLDATGGEAKIIDNPDGGGSVIVVGNRLLYDEFTSGDIKIRSANLNGGDLRTLVTGITRLVYAAVVYNPKDKKIYWGDRNATTIRRANLDGSQVQDYYKSNDGYPRAFALGKPK